MPNHIQNRLKIITWDQVHTIRESIKGGDFEDGSKRTIDFNKIIPQPSNIFNGNLGDTERKQCIAEGRPNWYDWNIANWGTKWGAYACNDKRDTKETIHFQTAWSAPEPIIEALAKMFPSAEMLWDYADEDTGSNAGRVIIKGGTTYWNVLDNSSKEAYELAFELNPGSSEYYEFIDGKYKYNEKD